MFCPRTCTLSEILCVCKWFFDLHLVSLILLLHVIELGSNSELRFPHVNKRVDVRSENQDQKYRCRDYFWSSHRLGQYVCAQWVKTRLCPIKSIFHSQVVFTPGVSHAWVAYGPSWLPVKPIDLKRDRWTNKGGWADFSLNESACNSNMLHCSIATSIPLPLNNPHSTH